MTKTFFIFILDRYLSFGDKIFAFMADVIILRECFKFTVFNEEVMASNLKMFR